LRECSVNCSAILPCCMPVIESTFSASARISKGQGYQGFLRKRAGSSFGQKRAIRVVQGKTWKMDRISLLLGSIKFKTL
jgi:hypothetical protein